MDAKPFVSKFLAYRQSAGVPSSFQLHRTADGWLHCFFLGSTPEAPSLDLYVCSVAEGAECTSDGLAWRPLVALPLDYDSNAPISLEEQLLRERMRTTSIGISSYTFDEVNHKLLIPAGGRLYITDVPTDSLPTESRLMLRELGAATHSLGPKLDAKLSADAKLMYFVRHNDLFALDIADGSERRLTFACQSGDDSFTAGVADYIMQEEFDRYSGFWPAPQAEKRQADGAIVYRVAYLHVDQSNVPKVSIQNPQTGVLETFRYPKAGQTNAVASIRVVEFAIAQGETLASVQLTDLSTKQTLNSLLANVEYVPRVGWAASSNQMWVQLLNRKQTELVLARLSIESDFVETQSVMEVDASAPFGQICLSEKSDIWINITHICEWLPHSDSFLWATEKSGYRHLELVTVPSFHSTGDAVHHAITSGEWQVDANRIWVDHNAKMVYFVGLADSHLRKQLYSASFDVTKSPNMQRLTDTKRSNSVHVNASLGLFVVTSSSATTPPRTAINEISKPISFDSTPLARIKHTRFAQPEVNMIVPQFVQVPCADGMLQGMVYLPQLYNKKNTYPTVIYVYGGPHVQLVRDEYSVTEMMRLQMLVNMGFVVGVVDGSGSWNRGLAFEGRIKHSMGQREVADQVALVNFLVAKGITDPNRVAVTGWSYGGYLSLMCLAQRADVFKVAICGAPVTNWETYDTGYTERYMDTPQDNAAGYESGNVLSYAHDFPEQEGRLVIAHGLLDENVHFTHTAALLDRLITLGKPYSLKLFPSERHGLRSITSSKYFHTLLATHLSANL